MFQECILFQVLDDGTPFVTGHTGLLGLDSAVKFQTAPEKSFPFLEIPFESRNKHDTSI